MNEDLSSQEPEVATSLTETLSEEQQLKNELQETKERHLRTLADMDNMRKRLQKEKLEHARFNTESALVEFLDPIDNLENALRFAAQSSPEVANWAQGFQMILMQFIEALSSQGIHAFTSTGMQFDPLLHEAIETEDSDIDGLILEEYVKGYKSKDRTIRPAKVKVTKKKSAEHK